MILTYKIFKSFQKNNRPASRTKRLTSKETTFRNAQSRESSMERVLQDDCITTRRSKAHTGTYEGTCKQYGSLPRTRSRSFEPKIILHTDKDKNSNEFEDQELTLDDLEVTKFSIDDIDINSAKKEEQNEVAFRKLSASLNTHKRKVII